MPSSPHASVTQPPWSVRIRPEQVSGMVRNGCPESIGTGVRNGPESATWPMKGPGAVDEASEVGFGVARADQAPAF